MITDKQFYENIAALKELNKQIEEQRKHLQMQLTIKGAATWNVINSCSN